MNETHPTSPSLKPPRRCVWRARWRWACLGCLLALLAIVAADKLFAIAFQELRETRLFFIASGAFALGELLSVTAAGLAGIGWILSPRPRRQTPDLTFDEG